MNSVMSIYAVQPVRGLTVDAPREVSASAGQGPTVAPTEATEPRAVAEPSATDPSRFNAMTPEEQDQVQKLKARDTEVRAHEQAHKNAGGQYAGAISYDYQTGPDGKRYAIGGEVPIDMAPEETPEETIHKMQIVIAAALAPTDPSPEDRAIANQAQKTLESARAELRVEKRAERTEAVEAMHAKEQAATVNAEQSYAEQLRVANEAEPTRRESV